MYLNPKEQRGTRDWNICYEVLLGAMMWTCHAKGSCQGRISNYISMVGTQATMNYFRIV